MTPELHQAIRQILAEMELLPYGSITAYNSSGGGHGESAAITPPGETRPLHLIWRNRFNRAADDNLALNDLLDQADAELRAVRVRGAGSIRLPERDSLLDDRQVLERRILLEAVGWPAEQVATAFRSTARVVRTIRLRGGQEPEWGHAAPGTPVDRATFVLSLTQRGYTQQEIARTLAISQPSVSRLLRTARTAA